MVDKYTDIETARMDGETERHKLRGCARAKGKAGSIAPTTANA